MKQILELKHWILFSIIFLLPVLSIRTVFLNVLSFTSNLETSLDLSTKFAIAFGILLVSVLIYDFWILSIGRIIGLKVLKLSQKRLIAFYIFITSRITFHLLTLVIFLLFFTNSIQNIEELGKELISLWTMLYLFSGIGSLYCIYFAGKQIKRAEYQREVGFGDCMDYFSLILFFPLGVWIIQPKLNLILKEYRKPPAVHDELV